MNACKKWANTPKVRDYCSSVTQSCINSPSGLQCLCYRVFMEDSPAWLVFLDIWTCVPHLPFVAGLPRSILQGKSFSSLALINLFLPYIKLHRACKSVFMHYSQEENSKQTPVFLSTGVRHAFERLWIQNSGCALL